MILPFSLFSARFGKGFATSTPRQCNSAACSFLGTHPLEGKKVSEALPRGRGVEVAGQTSQRRVRVLSRRRDYRRGFLNLNIAVRAEGELKD